jgi:hypothetical protein
LCDTDVHRKEPGGSTVTDVSRKYGWLVLAGYFALALAIPLLTPAADALHAPPPIGQMASLDAGTSDEAMMRPLRLQASAALHELQAAGGRQSAAAF